MSILIAMLLMTQLQKTTAFDNNIQVEPTKIVRLPFDIANTETTLEVSFDVEDKNSKVKLLVRNAGAAATLAETGYENEGHVTVVIPMPGKIWVDVDNRARRLTTANVRLTVKESWKKELPVEARELPGKTRTAVLIASLGLFFVTIVWAGAQIIPAWKKRNSPED